MPVSTPWAVSLYVPEQFDERHTLLRSHRILASAHPIMDKQDNYPIVAHICLYTPDVLRILCQLLHPWTIHLRHL